MYFFKRQIHLKTDMETAWAFIQDPRNLNRITPPDMSFKIVSDLPDVMYNGLLITYKVKLPFLGYQTWVSEIKHIVEGESFIDEQRFGPYKFWYHEHKLEQANEGVRMSDRVTYDLPFGAAGRLTAGAFVRKQLNKIFDYREAAVKEYFNQVGQ